MENPQQFRVSRGRAGRRAALEAYRAFAAAFPDADADLPIMVAACRELAALEKTGS